MVHAKETGWREDGHNGYAWTFSAYGVRKADKADSTPTERYFVHGRWDKGMVGGVLVSDLYAAYHHYPGEHQRCWAHLLGDIHDLKQMHPQDPALRGGVGQSRCSESTPGPKPMAIMTPDSGCGTGGDSSAPCWRCARPSAGTRAQWVLCERAALWPKRAVRVRVAPTGACG
ncbi:MAG: Transposase family [Dehalococcoidia bacterium]|nr:Transposase family [Dehalococcoidia bacterium]